MEISCCLTVEELKSNKDEDQNDSDSFLKSASYLNLIGLNLLAFGLELCSSAGFAYISPILMKNGFSYKAVAFITCLGSFLALVLVPMIGHWSDKCQSRFGRRRPFMLVLGVLTSLSLSMIPYSREIFTHFSIIDPCYGLAIAVVLFDFSCQALLNPCKALIPDIFHSTKDQNLGFTVFSCMMSLGGGFGYLVTSVNWTSNSIGIYFGGQEKAIFSMLSISLFIFLVINLKVAQEKPLTPKAVFKSCSILDKNANRFTYRGDEKILRQSLLNTENNFEPQNLEVPVLIEKPKIYLETSERNSKHLMFGLKKIISYVISTFKSCYDYIFDKYFNMPPVLFHLFIAYLFGSMGIICHDLYYTDFVGQVIYKGAPQGEQESLAIIRYDEGVRMGSFGLLLHCLSSAIYAALIQKRLIDAYGTFLVYLMGIAYFTLCMLGTSMTTSIIIVNIFSAVSGVGYAALTTLPYSLVAEYYNKKEIYYKSNSPRGVGEDMAVLDVAYVLAQIIVSLALSTILPYMNSSTTYMVFAAVCGMLGSYFTFFVTFPS